VRFITHILLFIIIIRKVSWLFY